MNRLEQKIDTLTQLVIDCCYEKNLKFNTPQNLSFNPNPSVPYISFNSKKTPSFPEPPFPPPAPPAKKKSRRRSAPAKLVPRPRHRSASIPIVPVRPINSRDDPRGILIAPAVPAAAAVPIIDTSRWVKTPGQNKYLQPNGGRKRKTKKRKYRRKKSTRKRKYRKRK